MAETTFTMSTIEEESEVTLSLRNLAESDDSGRGSDIVVVRSPFLAAKRE